MAEDDERAIETNSIGLRRNHYGRNPFFGHRNINSKILASTIMANPIHILKGWFHSQIYAPQKIKKISEERLAICRTCPYAVEKTFLKFVRGKATEETTKACKFCGCPIQEKSLVKEEKCPMNLWKK